MVAEQAYNVAVQVSVPLEIAHVDCWHKARRSHTQGHAQAYQMEEADIPVDDKNKCKQEDHKLDHPHHFLLWQLSEYFCDVHYMVSL